MNLEIRERHQVTMKNPSLHGPSKKVLQMKTWACQACFPRWKPTEGQKHNKPTHNQTKPKPKPMQDKNDLIVMEALSLLLHMVYTSRILWASHPNVSGMNARLIWTYSQKCCAIQTWSFELEWRQTVILSRCLWKNLKKKTTIYKYYEYLAFQTYFIRTDSNAISFWYDSERQTPP